MLIAGGTGGGKTYFILTLIEALLHTDSKLYILDPKNADLADLGSVMANVYYRKEDLLSCIETFYEEMMKRSEEMKQMKNYKTGKNYAYLGLPAHLIFDEYVAFMEMLGTKENTAVMNKLKQIVMLGRQAGFFLILACQRPDAKYLGDGIRDQFNFRVALGRMSEMGYGMMFGSDVQKDFFLKRIKGRGYVDVGTSVISEFYTPLYQKDMISWRKLKVIQQQTVHAGDVRSGSRRCDLLAGVAIATPALNPVSNRGTNRQETVKNIRKSFGYKGFISAYVKWALKVDIRLFDWRIFTE